MNDLAINNNNSQLILLNQKKGEIGFLDKLTVHQKGHFHRAFSILIFNGSKLLVQKRAKEKYHCGGLWSNSCCGHPSESSGIKQQAKQRLFDELGFDCELEFVQQYQYKADLDNSLIENELVDIFKGSYCGPINPSSSEVEAHKWVDHEELKENILKSPECYTPWFRLYCRDIIAC